MDARTAERATRWLTRRFGDSRSTISRRQVVEAAERDGLPREVQNVLQGLPDAEWPIEELVPTVRDALMVKIGDPTEGILP